MHDLPRIAAVGTALLNADLPNLREAIFTVPEGDANLSTMGDLRSLQASPHLRRLQLVGNFPHLEDEGSISQLADALPQ